MKSCKDCVYYDVCFKTQVDEMGWCDNYKDKSKFIELPCEVGDTVWYVCPHNTISIKR